MSAEESPPPASSKGLSSPWIFGLALFAVSFAVRYALARRFAAEPVWDGHYYEYYAKRIALGFGYSDGPFEAGVAGHPACHYPVGFSALLGVFYKVFGAKLAVARLFNATISALVPVLTWRLARFGLSPLRAKFAGILTALHPGLCLYAALVMSEPLSSALTLGAFVATYELRDARSRWALPIGALLLGVAALVRPQALLCAPVLFDAPLLLRTFREARDKAGPTRAATLFAGIGATLKPFFAQAIVVAVCCVLPVLPWTIRNCRTMDGCAVVSTNGGWNLAIGSFPRATGRFESLHASDAQAFATDEACKVATGQVQQDRCWGKYGVQQIVQHPIHWLKLVPAKLSYTFDHESFQVEYLHEARPWDFPDDVRNRAREAITLFHRLLMVAAAFACVGFVRGRPALRHSTQGLLFAAIGATAVWGFSQGSVVVWPLAALLSVVPWLPLPGAPPRPAAIGASVVFLGSVCLTHILFFGEDRYHVVASPVLCLLAAAAFRKANVLREVVAKDVSGLASGR